MAYCGANNVDSSTKSGENASAAGCLWLVDETGAYPVRAHCIGGGLTTMTTTTTKGEKAGVDTSTTVPVSDVVNRLLLEILRKERAVGHVRRPYFDLTAEEALEKLLVILLANESEDNPSSHGPLLPHGTRLELATVDSSQQRIVRKRVSDIWGRRMASHVTSV